MKKNKILKVIKHDRVMLLFLCNLDSMAANCT